MRWHRDQYLNLMTFGPCERPMFSELFGPLIGLDAEWRAQGATEDQLNMTAFDWDYVPYVGAGGNILPIGLPEPVVLEDSPTHRKVRDGFGRTMLLDKRTASIALPQDFPVKNMDDWLKIKLAFQFREDRIDEEELARAREARDRGAVVVAGILGGFDIARELMGEEVACMAYYDQPELMNDLLDTIRDTATQVLSRLLGRITIDQLSVHEDFAGKSGPLIGPSQIDEFIRPYYRAAWDIAQQAGARVFKLDTDGNINAVIDALLETGLTCIYPMEPAAGMDIVELRKKYGKRLSMAGGIDKFVLTKGADAIRAELEYKMQPLMRDSGGIIFGLDHRIPNGTPLAAYCEYVRLGREILGLPPLSPTARGWGRMAF